MIFNLLLKNDNSEFQLTEDLEFPVIYENYLKKLQEVYTRTDLSFIDEFIYDLQQSNGEFEKLEAIQDKYNCKLEFINGKDNTLFKQAGYGYVLNKLNIVLYVEAFEKLLNGDLDLNKSIFDLKRFLTHEDTHIQQGERSKNKAFKNYVRLGRLYSKNPEDNISYFNQQIEADAYARQIGFQIQQQYPGITNNEAFDLIKQNKIENEVLNVYKNKSNDISEKVRRKFWHTLWQYIKIV